MFRFIFLPLLLLANAAFGGEPLHYRLEFHPGDEFVSVSIHLGEQARYQADTLIIPRSAPGSYAITDYAAFVTGVSALTTSGEVLQGERGEGSYFTFPTADRELMEIRYRVDIRRMEAELKSGSETSKLRGNYLGLLGYSIFGYVGGLADRPVTLTVQSAPDWPIFSTLSPQTVPAVEQAEFRAASFAELADGQYLLGRGLQIVSVPSAPIPLFIAVYSEVEADLGEIGRRALLSLNGLAGYFGYIPMPHYTVVLEYLVPPTSEHTYGFWMEHLNSMTGSNDTGNAIRGYEQDPEIGGMVHHMAHAWIPLRSYGQGYRPFTWEIAPLIETIWLNEGFAWYIAYYNVLGYSRIVDFFNRTVQSAPAFIGRLSLKDLSRLGSTQYGDDFRIGMNLFSRGALLAHELDEEIQRKTDGAKSFRDVALGLLRWSEQHQRAFAYNEIEPIMSQAAGVDLSTVWDKWQAPMRPDSPGQSN